VALDSTYALAWTGLADAYTLSLPDEYQVPGIDPDSILTLAERAARRAIALAPRLGEAQSSLGEILEKRGRWPEATAAFQQGIRLSPSYPTGHQWYSYNLMEYDRWDEGIREMETAHRQDPLSHVITLSLAIAYDGADRFAEAAPLYAQGLAQSPEAWYAWAGLVGHELALGHMAKAAEAYRRYVVGEFGTDSAAAARIERGLDDPAARMAMIDEIRRSGDWLAPVAYSRWLRGDEATIAVLEHLDGALKGPSATLGLYAHLGPRLRADPRVRALVRRLGGPPLTR
jgi:tetratricopeptide (TPR) repeat protein